VTLTYNDAAHVHAVTSLSNGNTYQYDANGNQTTRVIGSDTYTMIYDAENRLIEVKKNSVSMATFVFDGDGRRVKSVVNGTTTYFAGGHYIIPLWDELTGSTVTKYYFAGSQRIAMRKYTIPQNMSVEYLLGDHPSTSLRTGLGSTSITTDVNGAKDSEMRYRGASLWDKPWGEVRYTWTAGLSTTPDYTLPSYTFTGQYSYMDDPSTSGVTEGFGLIFYGARLYDPAVGRFVQADPKIPRHQGIQAWDRYAYVNNNPMNYIDPTGNDAVPLDEWKEITAFIPVIADEYPSDSFTGEIVGGVVGAVVGLLCANVLCVGGGAIVGAVVGHAIQEKNTATNADLKEFANLMNALANDTDAIEDGMISGGTEYKFGVTTTNIYNADGDLVDTQTTYAFSVYVNGGWVTMTFATEEAYLRATGEFVRRGYVPHIEVEIIEIRTGGEGTNTKKKDDKE
jgi:RHS repeat-associated protein